MPTFQDREQVLEQICTQMDGSVLLDIYGEAGIGKSFLLGEAVRRLRATSPPSIVIYLDLQALSNATTDRAEALVRALITQSEGRLDGAWGNLEDTTGKVVTQLCETAAQAPVVLMFDTTEVFQEDAAFWSWMEAALVGPLVVEGRVRQVFAGRVPIPWHRIEVRRALQLVQLKTLSPEDGARDLVLEVIQQSNPDIGGEETLPEAVDLVLEFSYGHPLLSETLARYVAPRWPTSSSHQFKQQVCQEVIVPFLEGLLEGIMPPWSNIVWWLSVLDWFDVTFLKRYLPRVDPELVVGQTDYFFIQGIDRLRTYNTIVWREAQGDRLHGAIADIMRHCLEVSDPERYRQACRGAAETFEALAGEIPEGLEEVDQYRQEAAKYRQRAAEEAKDE